MSRGWRVAGQVLLSAAMVAAMGCWGLFSLVLLVLRCDDGCSGNQADDVRYTTQALLTAGGLALGVIAIVLGFTRRREAFWTTFSATALVAAVWLSWVLSGGF